MCSLCLNGTETQLNFLLDKSLHWKQQWRSPHDAHFLFILLFYCKWDVSRKWKTWKWFQLCLAVFLTMCTGLWLTLHLIGIISTLCPWKRGFKTYCKEYTCVLSSKVHVVYLYVKVPGSIKKKLLIWYVIAFSFLMFKSLFLQSIMLVMLLNNKFWLLKGYETLFKWAVLKLHINCTDRKKWKIFCYRLGEILLNNVIIWVIAFF